MVKVTCDICGDVMEIVSTPCYCSKCVDIWDNIDQTALLEKTVRAERRKQDGKGRRVRKVKEPQPTNG